MPSDAETLAARASRPEVLLSLILLNQVLQRALEQRRRLATPHDVLANIGHELRTPLTIIQGLSEILLDDLDRQGLGPELQQDFLRQIHRASLSLGKLVETSIMLTKIDTGRLQLHLHPLQLREAVERVLGQYREEIAARSLTVQGEAVDDLPPVQADGFCLELTLQALFDNAIKFNVQSGSITWRAWLQGERVMLAISDSGVGIPPEKLHALYTVFGQIDSGPTRRFGGLGLGLPLVRKILRSLGGDIRADSPGIDQGATFTCTFLQATGYAEDEPERV